MDEDDSCEFVPSDGTIIKRKRRHPDDIKSEKFTDADSIEDQLEQNLRRRLLRCESFWLRKSTLLTAEAGGKISLLKLKLLELDIGIQFRSAEEVVSAVKYL